MHHLAMGLQQARAVDRGRLSDREVNRLPVVRVLQTVGHCIGPSRLLVPVLDSQPEQSRHSPTQSPHTLGSSSC